MNTNRLDRLGAVGLLVFAVAATWYAAISGSAGIAIAAAGSAVSAISMLVRAPGRTMAAAATSGCGIVLILAGIAVAIAT